MSKLLHIIKTLIKGTIGLIVILLILSVISIALVALYYNIGQTGQIIIQNGGYILVGIIAIANVADLIWTIGGGNE